MKFTTAALLLAVCLSAFCGANAQNTTSTKNSTKADDLTAITTTAELYGAIEYAQKNLTIFAGALVIAYGEKQLTAPLAAGTGFIPTDEAFVNTLIALNMTLEDLAAMPTLVEALLSYHLTASPYTTAQSLLAAGSVNTLAGLPLEVKSGKPAEKSSIVIVAGQNDAKVTLGPLVLNKGKTVFYVIDNVLLPPQAAIDQVMASITPAKNSTTSKNATTPVAPKTNSTAPAPATTNTTSRSNAASATFSLAALAGLVLAALL